MISHSYRILLQQAYAFGNTSPENDMFAKPKNQIKHTRRRRITRDKSGNLVIHSFVTISATSTRSSKCNTTEQASRSTVYGRVLGAAEDQGSAHRDLLRYIYNPLCSGESANNAFWRVIREVNKYTSGLTSRQQYRVCCVVPTIMRDQFQVYRGGERRFTDSDICGIMGVKQSNYADHWERHIITIRNIVDRLEYQASIPVRELVMAMHDDELDDELGEELTEGIN